MAISKKALKKIDERVALYKQYIRYLAVGPQGLTQKELKNLILEGLIQYSTRVRAPMAEAYLGTHQQMLTGKIATPKSIQQGALDFLDRMMDRYSGKAVDQLKSEILSTIEGTINPIIDRREGQQIYEALQDKNLHKKNLRGLLKDKVDNWEYRWRTIVDTELNRASNWGAMDAILHNNQAKSPDQITVYKIGNKPGHGSCKYCAKFWYMEDGVTPRTYKLSELAANGTNIGKKAKDWLPTVDSTHPNETHTLHEIRPGYGFVNGNIDYVGDKHDEYDNQRKSS